jgi:hypothetical protein
MASKERSSTSHGSEARNPYGAIRQNSKASTAIDANLLKYVPLTIIMPMNYTTIPK